jgi:hypothetical protein
MPLVEPVTRAVWPVQLFVETPARVSGREDIGRGMWCERWLM